MNEEICKTIFLFHLTTFIHDGFQCDLSLNKHNHKKNVKNESHKR